jgi:putative RecB family exonuclease
MIPKHLSYSTLNQWERCPKAFQLQKIVGAPQKPAVYFAGGTAVHKATEALDGGVGTEPAQLFEHYFYQEVASLMEANDGLYWDTSMWLMGGSKDNPETCDDWMTIGPKCVENWVAFRGDREMLIELDLTGMLPGCPVPIKAFADRVWQAKEGVMIPDIKSGKSKPKDYFQLETYAALYFVQSDGGEAKEVGYFMAREGKFKSHKPQLLGSQVGERYGQAYKEMQEAEKTGEYPARREFTCQWCPMQDSCLTYSGQTAHAKKWDPDFREGRPSF